MATPGRKKGTPASNKHVPTVASRAIVNSNAGFGIEQAWIAKKLGIGVDTLRKHYAEELALGVQDVSAELAGLLMKCARQTKDRKSQITAIIWAQKNIAKWTDRISSSLGNPDGSSLGPSTVHNTLVYIPENGRDPKPGAALPAQAMKLIEGVVVEKVKVEK